MLPRSTIEPRFNPPRKSLTFKNRPVTPIAGTRDIRPPKITAAAKLGVSRVSWPSARAPTRITLSTSRKTNPWMLGDR